MNLPNKLTIARMALTPVFVACFYIPVSWNMYLAGALFVIAYITDMLDGQIARRKNLVTDFGKLMDPIADKILSAAALIMLTYVGLISPIVTLVTISREFVISGFRLIYANKNIIIAAGPLGKLKTLTQFIGVTLMLFLHPVFENWGVPVDQILIWISVVLAVWSCADYIIKTTKATKAA